VTEMTGNNSHSTTLFRIRDWNDWRFKICEAQITFSLKFIMKSKYQTLEETITCAYIAQNFILNVSHTRKERFCWEI